MMKLQTSDTKKRDRIIRVSVSLERQRKSANISEPAISTKMNGKK